MSHHIDLAKALRPYKVAETSDASMMLRLTRTIYYDIIVFLFICALLAFALRHKIAHLPLDALILVVLLFLVLFVLARAVFRSNPITIKIQKGFLTLRYRKFFGSIQEVTYDTLKMRSLQPEVLATLPGSVAGIRILLIDGNDCILYFSRTPFGKSLSARRAELITQTFSRLLSVGYVPSPRIEAP
jgi:hypothetical protein